MRNSYFLWPEGAVLRALASSPRLISVTTIEKHLKDMFPSGWPVLCSSGRAALDLALTETGVSRSDLVGMFPYASHCVLSAVSKTSSPLLGDRTTSTPLRIVYHQWGYVQETDLPDNTIEDCVDTLCIPGATLFPGGGQFEIWSLPKILGTKSGAVLWCRDEKVAAKVKLVRDQRGNGLLQWGLRLLSGYSAKAYYYWQGAEIFSGGVSILQTGEIWLAILGWEAIVSDRRMKIDTVWPRAVNWLRLHEGRLPSVVPIMSCVSEPLIKEMGIVSGFRMMEHIDQEGNRTLERVVPIPIHQEVPAAWLADIIKKLGCETTGG